MGNEDVKVPLLPTSSRGSSSPSPLGSSLGKSSGSQSSPSSSQKLQNLNKIYQRSSSLHLFANFSMLSSIEVEHSMYEEYVTKPICIDAMNEEMHAIEKNDSLELVPLPKDK